MDREDITIFGVLIALVLIVGFFAYKGEQADEAQWNAYAAAHHCVVNGTKKGTTDLGYAIGGKSGIKPVITTTPDQTIYACDGGEIQIR